MCSGSLGDKGSVEAEVGKKLEMEEKNTGLKRGMRGEQLRVGRREGTGGEGSIWWGFGDGEGVSGR